MFHKPLSLFGRGYAFRHWVLNLHNVFAVPCHKRTSSETRQLNKNACDPDSGGYGRGSETTDVDRINTDMYTLH